ncbi:hypothetical protein [Thiomicrospira sp. S5]|uniref:hypothetical protein n=1 Tax=Thiomicrospira sp. S5 TaxID=1803865 RepID=UPI000F8A07FC|nr:hypothetical protein [Thiomicrospira sp. S5]AZR82343.1 hypothetical protein AYJ59_08630 [Thiomicrospira sp. S5]
MSEELGKYLNRISDDIAKSLQDTALDYFNLGIRLYQDGRKRPWQGFQTVLGNLSIACELLLKAIIARKMFSCLYPNLSKEALAMLHYPEAMPPGATPNVFIGDLRNFTEKVIDISQAISYFYQLYPDKKQEFKPHLSLLAPIRNIAVHAAFPEFQKYHLERVAYIACKLFQLAKDDEVFKWLFMISNQQEIDSIIKRYDDERVTKVHKAIEQAKIKSKSLDFLYAWNFGSNEWEMRDEKCPVCKNDAICYGYTEEDETEDGISLWFVKDQFECDNCGLVLDDADELELAGIETSDDLEPYLEEWFEYKAANK